MFAELESLMSLISLVAFLNGCLVIHQVRSLSGRGESECFEKRQVRLNKLKIQSNKIREAERLPAQ